MALGLHDSRSMRSSAHIDGHPIHPMLVGFPLAYLLGTACLDVFARVTNRPRLFRTALHLSTLGLGSALAAAVPGLLDYFSVVPPKSSAMNRATKHLLANVSALGLFALARAGRKSEDAPPARWSVGAEVVGAGLLTTGGWIGGTLVYRNQIAVDHRYANAGRWQVQPVAPRPELPSVEQWLDVAATSELEVGQMKLLRVADPAHGERRIVLARTGLGYAAFDDRCTHKGGPLSDGALVGDTVQCPWHGSQFDAMTGRVQAGPASERIGTYATEERDGRVRITLDQQSKS
jgi:nitrite reductase/ring-hydroxylating ferredoxin subunit/uncharacterized membrane protein